MGFSYKGCEAAATTAAFDERHAMCDSGSRTGLLFAKCRRSRLGHSVVVLASAAAYAHCADNLSAALQRNAAGEDHDASMIGDVNSEKLVAALRILTEVFGGDIKSARGKCLVHRNVDAADPCAFHAFKCDEIGARVNNGDVHWYANLLCLFLPSANDGAGLFERDSECF